jgi:transcriptional regulator with XRE-family HTH domain
VDNAIYANFGGYGALMNTKNQLIELQMRLRVLREARKLTLQDASELSHGTITAIALGSYERGDRAISAGKLLEIAAMYGVPISELFTDTEKSVINARTTIDIRKVLKDNSETSRRLSNVIANIARVRRDWNGEVISLRSEDLTNLSIFTGFTTDEITAITKDLAIPRSK